MVDSNAERAQLLLITALLIATFIMSAVVLLNLLHESPSFDTQQDSLSMSDTERVSAQLEADLQQYFYAHSSDELVGYAEEGDFDGEIDELGSRYTNLIGQSASGHLNVEYNSGESEMGAIVYGNETTETEGSEQIFTEVGEITRFYLEATGDGFVDITFNMSDGTDVFEISEEDVSWNDESVEWDQFVEVDFTYGGGEIRTDEGYLSFSELETDEEFNVSADINHLEEGRFYISTQGGSNSLEPDSRLNGENGVIVNPAFDISYTNPDIRYSNTIQLFEERDQ